MRPRGAATTIIALVTASALGQLYEENLPLDHPAIQYWEKPHQNAVARLEQNGTALDFQEGGLSYLPSLFEHLHVRPDSQSLVFSKTSLQRKHISPRTPRALYFGDDVAIGFLPGSDVIEIAAVEPGRGVVFYTLATRKADNPQFHRPKVCLECHQGPATLGVPGMYVGSVTTTPSGRPDYRGSIVSDHRTPFEDRWGGWFVDASDGAPGHSGNTVASGPAGGEMTPLLRSFDESRYPVATSDIVALMTLEHQTQATNLLTRLGWEVRLGADSEKITERIEELVRYVLFEDAVSLPEPIESVSTFVKTFPERGPRDRKGRSLRDFELETRLFRYPLSYTIYSAAFEALPDMIRERIYRRVFEILTGSDRQTILEILRDTKTDLPSGL